MNDEPCDLPSMAYVGSRYMVRVTPFTQAGGGWERALIADPMRYYMRAEVLGPPPAQAYCMAQGAQALPIPFAGVNYPRESKWRDDVAACAGEWYVLSAAGVVWTFTEVIFMGD